MEKTAATFNIKAKKSPVMNLDDIAKQSMVLDADSGLGRKKIAKNIDEFASVSSFL